ncbi:MAG: ArsR/SmtB family transcription factor [Candidatus Woesearchaeota archaeon]
MEQETLFTSSKWDILKCLEKGKKSPIDLAREANTSIANISQQLRLLELAGFVRSERMPNREKGQPRILYSLAGAYSYLIVSSDHFVDKKFMKLEEYQRAILKIWFIEDKVLQYYIEKFYWMVEHLAEKIDFLSVDLEDTKTLKVYVINDSSDTKKILKDAVIDGKYGEKTFVISQIKETDLKKIKRSIVLIDKKNITIKDT